MYTTYYYTMLQQLLLHCYLYCFIELLVDSYPMLQDIVGRCQSSIALAYSLLPLYFYLAVHYTASPFSFDTCIKAQQLDVRLAGMLDTHTTLFSLLFCLIGCCSRRWSPGAGDPRCRLRHGVPPRPGVVWRFPGRRPRLFNRCCFCASLLKATLYSRVYTQILLLPLTCVSWVVVFEPSWPLACNIKLVLFYLQSCAVITSP